MLTTHSSLENRDIVENLKHDLSSSNFFELNIADVIIDYALLAYFNEAINNELMSMGELSNLLKIGYALLLLQISARVIYEKNEFYIKNRESELSIDNLTSMIKNMNAKLMISGQPIETSDRFVEGSLSYLRKVTALIYILCDRNQGYFSQANFIEHHHEIKKLSNSMFG